MNSDSDRTGSDVPEDGDVTAEDFRPPTTDTEWASYHAIRRRVLFELRGNAAAYDAHHPDDHPEGDDTKPAGRP